MDTNVDKDKLLAIAESINETVNNNPELANAIVDALNPNEVESILNNAGIKSNPEISQALYDGIRKCENDIELVESDLEEVSGGIILEGYALSVACWAIWTAGTAAIIYGFYKGLKEGKKKK